jgi:hypothetical protein
MGALVQPVTMTSQAPVNEGRADGYQTSGSLGADGNVTVSLPALTQAGWLRHRNSYPQGSFSWRVASG